MQIHILRGMTVIGLLKNSPNHFSTTPYQYKPKVSYLSLKWCLDLTRFIWMTRSINWVLSRNNEILLMSKNLDGFLKHKRTCQLKLSRNSKDNVWNTATILMKRVMESMEILFLSNLVIWTKNNALKSAVIILNVKRTSSIHQLRNVWSMKMIILGKSKVINQLVTNVLLKMETIQYL